MSAEALSTVSGRSFRRMMIDTRLAEYADMIFSHAARCPCRPLLLASYSHAQSCDAGPLAHVGMRLLPLVRPHVGDGAPGLV